MKRWKKGLILRFCASITCLSMLTTPIPVSPLGPHNSFAAEKPKTKQPTRKRIENEELEIPKTPTKPPMLEVGSPPPKDSFRCPRLVMYRGKTLNCDSNLRWDGEALRPIFEGAPTQSPEALEELNIYQTNRNTAEALRYVGGTGALLLLMGIILPSFMDEESSTLRNIGVFGGLGLSVGGFAWGQILLSHNEKHLGRAVKYYNEKNPQDTIELQFSTGVNF